jgi:hypothetical protein
MAEERSDMKTYIVDIDGTVANAAHRLYFIQGETKGSRRFFQGR